MELEKDLERWVQEEPEQSADRQEWYVEGARVYRNLLEEDPQNHLYQMGLANVLIKIAEDQKFREECFKEARAVLNSVLELDPRHGLAHYHLGYIEFETNHYDEAIRQFRFCFTPKVPPIYRLKTFAFLSKCYHILGQEEQAAMCQETCRNMMEEMTMPDDRAEGNRFFQDLKKFRQGAL